MAFSATKKAGREVRCILRFGGVPRFENRELDKQMSWIKHVLYSAAVQKKHPNDTEHSSCGNFRWGS